MEILIVVCVITIFLIIFICVKKYKELNAKYDEQFKYNGNEIKQTLTNFTKSAKEQNEEYILKNEIYTIIKNLKIIKWLLIILTVIAILFTIKEICTIIFLMNLPELLPEILEEVTKNIKLF